MRKEKLYMIVDVDNEDFPLIVGTMKELCKYSGKTQNQIRSAISHAEKRGSHSRYIRLSED